MNVNATFFVIMIELLAVESLVLIVISALYIKRRYQCKIILQNIIDTNTSTEAARQQVLENTLQDIVKEDENAAKFATRLVKAESRYQKKLLSTFIAQDHEGLARLGKWTDDLLSPYRMLISETTATSKEEKAQLDKRVAGLEHTVQTLATEKEQLNQQADKTKEELDGIMSEYISAFKKGEEATQEKEGDEQGPDKAAATKDNGTASAKESVDEGITAIPEEADDVVEPAPTTARDPEEVAEEDSITITTEDETPTEEENDGDDELLKVADLEETEAMEQNSGDETTPETETSTTNPASDAILDDVDMAPPPAEDNTAVA